MAFGALAGMLGGLAKGAVGTVGAVGGAALGAAKGIGTSLAQPYLDESGSFSLAKLLQNSEFSVRTPRFSLRLGDRNRRITDALMKRVEEMTLGKTDPITTSALDVGGESDPVSGMTSVFRPDPFRSARGAFGGSNLQAGPQRLRMM